MSRFDISVNGKPTQSVEREELHHLDIIRLGDSEYHTTDENQSYHTKILEINLEEKIVIIDLDGKRFLCKICDSLDLILKSLNLNNKSKSIRKDLISTMPGMVLEILVEQGQNVEKGDPLMILEAMKMENILKAGQDGSINKICCNIQDAVEKGQLLIEIV